MMSIIGCGDQGVNIDAAGPFDSPFTSSINGKNIACCPGQVFSLELFLHFDSGYSWDYTISNNTIVRIDSTPSRPTYNPTNSDSIMVGGVAIETFYFRAMKPGNCTINLIEHRGWLPNEPPMNSVRFNVSVHN